MAIDWSEFVKIVRSGERFVLTSHMRSDCDALGSELAMASILESLGKQVMIVNGDAPPSHLAFIDPDHRVMVLGDDANHPTRQACEAADVLMILDTSAWVQLGPMAEVVKQTTARKVVVDHHLSEDDLSATCFKDIDAEATGRLMIEAADALGVVLTQQIAEPLLAAIATDTGWFRFSSVSEQTFRAVARLVASGARPQPLFNQLYERNTLARVHLRGTIMANAASELGGKVIVSEVRQTDFADTGAEPSDTEDTVNQLMTVAGSEVAVLMVELSSGKIKASLRSRGNVDVRSVAEQFGGGGHRAAAGVSLECPLAEARTKILDALAKVV